jgi:hypothetical protein
VKLESVMPSLMVLSKLSEIFHYFMGISMGKGGDLSAVDADVSRDDQATLNSYRLTLTALLRTLGDQPERFEARALRAFVREWAGQGGSIAPERWSPQYTCFCAFSSPSAAAPQA